VTHYLPLATSRITHLPLATSWITHEAETGGGPTGFGWASFVAMLLGLAAIAYMLGRYLQILAESRRNKEETDGTNSALARSTPRPTSPTESGKNFDPYDDLHRE
jgi:hypothetical protein